MGHLAVALGAGLIIGLERGWSRVAENAIGPGIRTFTLVALLGGTLASLDVLWLTAIGFVGVGALAMLGYRATAKRFQDYGYTTEVAVLMAYASGVAAGMAQPLLAASVAVVTALALGLKPELHEFVGRLKRLEVLSTIQLLVVALVLLPILPREDVWLPGLNFRTIGWFVLLILSLSYLGYVSVRLLGDRLGILLTSLFGGLTSSTAVTATFGRLASRQPQAIHLISSGTLLANAVMPVRLLILATIVNNALLAELAPPLLMLAGIPVVLAIWGAVRSSEPSGTATLALKNPLELKAGILFAAYLTVLFIAVPWLEGRFGSQGLYVASLFSGLTDVDAIGLTLARKSNADIALEVAGTAIVLAALANTAVKAGLAALTSNGALTRSVSLPLLAAMLLCGVTFAL